MIFACGRNWPRGCRARVDVFGDRIIYIETWASGKNNRTIPGQGDRAKLPECERIARALAGLDLSEVTGSGDLPESVRLYDLLDISSPSTEILTQNWQRPMPNDEMLQFSLGFRSSRKGIVDVKVKSSPRRTRWKRSLPYDPGRDNWQWEKRIYEVVSPCRCV